MWKSDNKSGSNARLFFFNGMLLDSTVEIITWGEGNVLFGCLEWAEFGVLLLEYYFVNITKI